MWCRKVKKEIVEIRELRVLVQRDEKEVSLEDGWVESLTQYINETFKTVEDFTPQLRFKKGMSISSYSGDIPLIGTLSFPDNEEVCSLLEALELDKGVLITGVCRRPVSFHMGTSKEYSYEIEEGNTAEVVCSFGLNTLAEIGVKKLNSAGVNEMRKHIKKYATSEFDLRKEGEFVKFSTSSPATMLDFLTKGVGGILPLVVSHSGKVLLPKFVSSTKIEDRIISVNTRAI